MSVWERQVKVHEAMVKEKTRAEPESADQMGAEMGLDLIRDEAAEYSFLEMMQVTPVNIRHLSVMKILVRSHLYGGGVVRR